MGFCGLIKSVRYNLYEMGKMPNRKKSKVLDEKSMRNSLRFWATGVTIVSVAHDGAQHGMTVNSFTSLSLDPLLVLVSLEKGTRTHEMVAAAGVFAVTLLNQEQEALSERFAGRESEGSDRFLNLEIVLLDSKNPILAKGLAFFDCRVQATYSVGSHSIFIAEVVAAGDLPAAQIKKQPLLYYNRAYRRLSDS